jgi:hypothetical protein
MPQGMRAVNEGQKAWGGTVVLQGGDIQKRAITKTIDGLGCRSVFIGR